MTLRRLPRTYKMELTVPADGKLHEVVGRTLEEQTTHQLKLVTKLLVGPNGSLPDLPADSPPNIAFWDNLRQKFVTAGVRQDDSGNSNSRADSSKVKNLKANQTNVTLETLLKVVPVGHEIIAHLWLIDTAAVGKLASASMGCYEAVAIHVSKFDLPAGEYRDCDWLPEQLARMDDDWRANIDIRGIGRNLFVRGRALDTNPYAKYHIKDAPAFWSSPQNRDHLRAISETLCEDNSSLIEDFARFHRDEQKLTEIETAWRRGHEKMGLAPIAEDADKRGNIYLAEMSYNIPMLRSLSQYGGALTSLQLHEVPMMDLRILELILSACPALEILGIDKCELLHVADINPILDIAFRRAKKTGKKLRKLQFYPRSYTEPAHNRTGTHVLSWNPLKTNVETSLLITVFWAILKAVPMGIDLVSKGQPFRQFLDLVPMRPGQVAVFLHHVFKWLEAVETPGAYDWLTETQSPEGQFRNPGLLMLEDQVLLSMLQGTKGCKTMLKHKRASYYNEQYECCQCGCEMLAILFREEMKSRAADHRVCRICDLRGELNGESHHRLHDKRTMLNRFLYSPNDIEDKTDLSDDEMQSVSAPPRRNPFIKGETINGTHREEAVLQHRSLPKVQVLIGERRNFDILNAAGQAAMYDAEEAGWWKAGIFNDHPTMTKQTPYTEMRVANQGMLRKQSWEYVMWKNYYRDSGLAEQQAAAMTAGHEPPKPAGFW
ncbi:hypothetical protein CTAM01_01293 [Colletotrichum tamarilloi]|uniref:F-box domain-containing protein n=1 Tax=Colletotrichum tamarilloi TaxID=1209934 RepID=A0ABQ9RQW4_9PEZI|nr:uncharacterized protein CTAM01_01293 [Colletotrichum tamarilloi]KAK1510720.1 hypothetical protein CTAM01_01293 [Colletotrichum tamarilloi]